MCCMVASRCGGIYLEMFVLVAMVQPAAAEVGFGLSSFCGNTRRCLNTQPDLIGQRHISLGLRLPDGSSCSKPTSPTRTL